MDGVGVHLRREVPIHVLMLGVMVLAMLSPTPLVSIAGATLLVAVSVPCAALSRAHGFLRAHVLDLWAMALVLLASVPSSAVPSHPSGHHALTVPSGWAFAAIVAAWGAGRVWLGRRGSADARRAVVASGAVTGAGLAAMVLFCA